MALRHPQKKSIRRKRRFLKRKSAKTHRRTLTKRRIMRGGANPKWNVKVYYCDTTIDYGDTPTPNTPYYDTPGTFTDPFPSEESEKSKNIVFGTLTLTSLNKTFYNTKFRVNDNEYVAENAMFITPNHRFIIRHFEKVSEINEELPIGAVQFPSAPLIETSPPPPPPQKWWPFSKKPSSPY